MSSFASSDQSRGQNALQRRQQQLKRWQELEAQEEGHKEARPRQPKVKFSLETLFLSSVQQNDFEECERLLKKFGSKLDVNATSGDGLTALHQMAIDDNREMTEWLLRNGADVNVRDNEGWTPLHAAASCGHVEIVRLLLSREDCDVFAVNCDAELARDVCDGDECLQLIDDRMRRQLNDRRRHATTTDDISEEVLEEMRRKELQKIETDFEDFLRRSGPKEPTEMQIKEWLEGTRDPVSKATVIHVCAAKGYDETLKRILEAIKEKTNSDEWKDCDGFTPLMAAAFWRQIACFELLLRFGANFELKTNDLREIADLCHENQKILDLINETKRTRELHAQKVRDTTAETQRKLNAKRQRESRRSTQGVTKEDIELALKTQQIENSTTETTPPTSPVVTTATTPTTAVTTATTEETPLSSPPMPSSPPPTIFTLPVPSQPSIAADNTQDNHISTTISVPLYPQRRRPKRRSTGIGDELTTRTTEDDTQPAVAPSVADANNESQNSIFGIKTPSTTSSVSSSPQRSRSSSRQSSGSQMTTDSETERSDDRSDDRNDRKTTALGRQSSDSAVDYKALYLEVSKENEFLVKKIKDFEEKRNQVMEFQREKRQLLRRIGELEEELKTVEELQKENQRLKEENSALIRVISKLSK